MEATTNPIRKLAENGNAGVLAHMTRHDEFMGGKADPDNCDHCYVSSQGWLKEIYDAVFNGGSNATVDLIWSMQDGYGVAGFTPPQGFDWSGIRDSSPATIQRMWQALHA